MMHIKKILLLGLALLLPTPALATACFQRGLGSYADIIAICFLILVITILLVLAHKKRWYALVLGVLLSYLEGIQFLYLSGGAITLDALRDVVHVSLNLTMLTIVLFWALLILSLVLSALWLMERVPEKKTSLRKYLMSILLLLMLSAPVLLIQYASTSICPFTPGIINEALTI